MSVDRELLMKNMRAARDDKLSFLMSNLSNFGQVYIKGYFTIQQRLSGLRIAQRYAITQLVFQTT